MTFVKISIEKVITYYVHDVLYKNNVMNDFKNDGSKDGKRN